jgi:hypothetical protein
VRASRCSLLIQACAANNFSYAAIAAPRASVGLSKDWAAGRTALRQPTLSCSRHQRAKRAVAPWKAVQSRPMRQSSILWLEPCQTGSRKRTIRQRRLAGWIDGGRITVGKDSQEPTGYRSVPTVVRIARGRRQLQRRCDIASRSPRGIESPGPLTATQSHRGRRHCGGSTATAAQTQTCRCRLAGSAYASHPGTKLVDCQNAASIPLS